MEDPNTIPKDVFYRVLKMLEDEREKNTELVNLLLDKGVDVLGVEKIIPIQEGNEKQIISGGRQPWYRVKNHLEKKFSKRDSAESTDSANSAESED